MGATAFNLANFVGDSIRWSIVRPGGLQQAKRAYQLLGSPFKFAKKGRVDFEFVTKKGKRFTQDDFVKAGSLDGMIASEVGDAAFSKVDYVAKFGDSSIQTVFELPGLMTVAKGVETADTLMNRVATYRESFGRLAAMIHELDQGKSLANAHVTSGEVFVNYNVLSKLGQEFNGILAPFYTWFAWNNSSLFAAATGRYGGGTLGRMMLAQYAMGPAVWAWNQTHHKEDHDQIIKVKPWLKDALILGAWTDGNGDRRTIHVNLSNMNPINRAADMIGLGGLSEAIFRAGTFQMDEAYRALVMGAMGEEGVLDEGTGNLAKPVLDGISSTANPVLKGAVEVLQNKNTFTGAPVYKESDDAATRHAKIALHLGKTVLPAATGPIHIAQEAGLLPAERDKGPFNLERALLDTAGKITGMSTVIKGRSTKRTEAFIDQKLERQWKTPFTKDLNLMTREAKGIAKDFFTNSDLDAKQFRRAQHLIERIKVPGDESHPTHSFREINQWARSYEQLSEYYGDNPLPEQQEHLDQLQQAISLYVAASMGS
jgi:hypothetical protein